MIAFVLSYTFVCVLYVSASTSYFKILAAIIEYSHEDNVVLQQWREHTSNKSMKRKPFKQEVKNRYQYEF